MDCPQLIIKLVSTLFIHEKVKTGNALKLFVVNMLNFNHVMCLQSQAYATSVLQRIQGLGGTLPLAMIAVVPIRKTSILCQLGVVSSDRSLESRLSSVE